MANTLRNILASLAFMGMLFGPSQAQAITTTAATSRFYLDWSGLNLWGNSAEAHGILTIDNASFPNPSEYAWLLPGQEVVDFSLTVSGADSGNGTFQLTDFDGFVWDTVVSLDFSRELVGQETGNGGWGVNLLTGTTNGDFNLVAAENSFAPTLNGSFLLMTNNDTDFGTQMNLVSFRPVPIPAAFWLFGSALLGLMGVGHRRSVQA